MKKIWIAYIWLFMGVGLSHAVEYYVGPAGADTNTGSTLAPWATPGYASKQLLPGDTLTIRSGTYIITNFYDDIIWTVTNGTSNAWISIQGATGDYPIIMGTSNISHAVNIADRSFLRIEHLELCSLVDSPYSGGMRSGIVGLGPGHTNIIIRDVIIHHVEEMGISLAGNAAHITIDNAHIHHTGYTAIGGDYHPEGQPGWQYILITNCLLEHMGLYRQGLEIPSDWDRPDGVGFETSLGPIEIADTTVRLGYGDGLDSKSQQTWIHHCTVANNYADGIKLWGGDSRVENTLVYGTGWTQPGVITPWCLLVIDTTNTNGSFRITNCSFFDDDRRANNHYLASVQYDSPTIPIDLTLKNNIFSGLGQIFVRPIVTLHAENNLFDIRADSGNVQLGYGTTNYYTNTITSLGPGNLSADPGFISPSWGPTADFHLWPASHTINQGQTNSLTDDLEHTPRPLGTLPDIGAYEFNPSADMDNDGLPDWWERAYFANPTNALPAEDTDTDQTSNWSEYIAGTSPIDNQSTFALTAISSANNEYTLLKWSSVSGRYYTVEQSTDINTPFQKITTNILATPPENTFTNTSLIPSNTIYRIRTRK